MRWKKNPFDLIEAIVRGELEDPVSGKRITVPVKIVMIEDSLAGKEVDLLRDVGLRGPFSVVSDKNTEEALGKRVKTSLSQYAKIIPICLRNKVHSDLRTAQEVISASKDSQAIIAVGAGTINDLCKYAASSTKKPYVVFPTAPSMNGYTSVNAAIMVNGLKESLPAAAPLGVFIDVQVLSHSPIRMIRSGFADTICRPTAQADWLLSHLVFETEYSDTPFRLLKEFEQMLLSEPKALVKGDTQSIRILISSLVLSGFGMCIAGGSFPASQGEHLISHYLEMCLGDSLTSLHGEQIGIATLVMARLQEYMLNLDKLVISPSKLRQAEVLARYGESTGRLCWEEYSKKYITVEKAEELNNRFIEKWDDYHKQIDSVTLSPENIKKALQSIDAPLIPEDIDIPRPAFLEAIKHAREIRHRYTFLDLASDSGNLDPKKLID
ncbi:MAG: sn-glycerol-1-phosphate dehydrogenase [Spirochaetota bacterium]